MPSFWMSYDAEDDVLEVTFADYDARLSRAVALNDHVVLYCDPGLAATHGFTFHSFTRLLGVSETELTGLRSLSTSEAESAFSLLIGPPASLFLDVTDAAELIARVRGPGVEQLVAGEE